MILLKEGVFQLEKGHGPWKINQCGMVVISFASSETGLTLKKFEDS